MNNKKIINVDYLLKIYKKYSNELQEITKKISLSFSKVNKSYRATFSDFEGEILYCLIRDRKPKLFYEISPDCGYSTIYISSAFKKNKTGEIVSFEIEPVKFKINTEELIRKNIEEYAYPNHKIVIGDVTQTIKDRPNPDMVLIDSCHEAWFAEWYLRNLVPKVKDLIFLQDIVFYDRVEYSGEARTVLKFLENKNFISLGLVERTESFRNINNLFPKRRSFESNSIIFRKNKIVSAKPYLEDITKNNLFSLNISKSMQYKIENLIEYFPKRQNAHRAYLRMSLIKKKKYFVEKAIGLSIQEYQNSNKPYVETQLFLLRHLLFSYLFITLLLKPVTFFELVRRVLIIIKEKLNRS